LNDEVLIENDIINISSTDFMLDKPEHEIKIEENKDVKETQIEKLEFE